jgi:hypothetical protein
VTRDHEHPVSDPDGARGPVQRQDAVLVAGPAIAHLADAPRLRRLVIGGRGLVARVDRDLSLDRLADRGAQDEQRRLEVVEDRAGPSPDGAVHHIHEHVGAGLDVGHALDVAVDVVGPGPPDRQGFHLESGLLRQSAGTHDPVQRLEIGAAPLVITRHVHDVRGE